eukprot:CAMPEP_0182553138 /NCGR_PEP_ID=MMETSP1323-20130603/49330_1 /TAXON_ID=236787 /ORGANISM="Florenciella parvula, Strain RCC1693" /LENGTH=556 /DNA_ID=CAMNT_0024764851 /DNA_START=37 /DNA_END=1708 /DNA_ORIENTATION=+
MFRATLIALALGGANASFFTNETKSQKYMWESYKTEFGKQYPTMQEENTRFGIFMNNLAVIDQRNAAEAAVGGDAVHGINKFTDLSQEEFATRYLLSDVSFKSGKKAEVAQVKPLPEGVDALVDWTGTYTTPVKDQGYCGSCWAFSATEQIESDCMRVSGEPSDAMRALGSDYILSPAQITQCDSTSDGCGGGWTENAYSYVQKAGGLTTDSIYPYPKSCSSLGVTGSCQSVSSSDQKITVTGYSTLKSESQMASYVESTGPLSVCLDANSFNSYTSGIMSVCGTSVDHCVQAVGVDTASGYWKVRNSWGTSWGESGFIRLAYGANTCDITNDPTYVTMAKRIRRQQPVAFVQIYLPARHHPGTSRATAARAGAFSATEQIESDCMRVSGETPILSPEQITQCDSTSYGCNGGWTENAYDYVQSAGGMCSESDYPYTSGSGTTGTCKRSLPSTSCAITGYKTISGESAMASYVESTGPLSVCLDANSFNSYTSGIMSVCGTSVDHCVQAVGVDTASGYWKVRNSWGTSWGESGFIRLAYGANTCDITNDPTYVTMA